MTLVADDVDQVHPHFLGHAPRGEVAFVDVAVHGPHPRLRQRPRACRGEGLSAEPATFCDQAPVVVSARRDGAFGSALFCADCASRVRDGDEVVITRIPRR